MNKLRIAVIVAGAALSIANEVLHRYRIASLVDEAEAYRFAALNWELAYDLADHNLTQALVVANDLADELEKLDGEAERAVHPGNS